MKTNKLLAAAAVALLMAPLASQAVPVFQARVSDGTNTINVVDNGVGDSSAIDGLISFSGALGGWNVTFAIGTSQFDPLEMHLTAGFNVLNPSAVSPKVLTISMTQTGLTAGSGSVHVGAHGGGSGTTGVTSSWAAYVDDSDALFGTGSLVVSSNGFSTTAGSANVSLTDLYSATLVANFDISGAPKGPLVLSSGSQDLTMAVPEPGTIGLAGLALLAVGALRRRKA